MTFEMDNVELSYNGKKILYGVYLKAETGKISGILGPNGCGKTSALRMFFGNLEGNNKLVRIDNKGTLKPLYTVTDLKYLPQTDFLPSNLRLSKLFRIYQVSWNEFLEKLPSFRSYEKSTMKELSGGEKRMIGIWLSIKSKAQLVLLDEPFTHLTPIYTSIIKKELILEKSNKAIILTDHMYKDLLEITDDLYFIKEGCSRLVKDPADLKELGYIRNF